MVNISTRRSDDSFRAMAINGNMLNDLWELEEGDIIGQMDCKTILYINNF